MKYIDSSETIVALSTPPGRGAIAVVRVSGEDTLPIINQLFSHQLGPDNHRQLLPGNIHTRDDCRIIDECVVSYFRGPHSYTGEDVAEISCHGNPLIADQIIQEIISCGARMAQPGEFTRRAFMNHKMDLSQAEAVASLIEARTRQGLSCSLRQLEGGLSERLNRLQEEILNILSLIEVSLDFNEDDVRVYEKEAVLRTAERVFAEIGQLLNSYDYGRLLREGIKLLLLGKPNVGKSSLLNMLLQTERAIVSEIPGTTRDYIEEYTQLEGFPVRIVDTAGIRETLDRIEELGVQRALRHIESSDLVLAVFEGHRSLDADDLRLIEHLKSGMHRRIPLLLVLNKADLGSDRSLPKQLRELGAESVMVSAKTGHNFDQLRARIKQQLLGEGSMEEEGTVVSSARHKEALLKTRGALQKFIHGIRNNFDDVILAADLRCAVDEVGEIVGAVSSEELLNHIFAGFCIGK
jgi:tRNA modification GTPase